MYINEDSGMNNDDREILYDMIEDIDTAMLVTKNGDDLRSRRMKGKLYRSSMTYGARGRRSGRNAKKARKLNFLAFFDSSYIPIAIFRCLISEPLKLRQAAPALQ